MIAIVWRVGADMIARHAVKGGDKLFPALVKQMKGLAVTQNLRPYHTTFG